MDEKTTLAELRDEVIRFRDERDWEQFHGAKDLALGLGIEVGELQELMLWKSEEEIRELAVSAAGGQRLREEMADVFVFLLYLSRHFGIDLSEAVREKLLLNAKKYPVEKSHGSKRKYTEF